MLAAAKSTGQTYQVFWQKIAFLMNDCHYSIAHGWTLDSHFALSGYNFDASDELSGTWMWAGEQNINFQV